MRRRRFVQTVARAALGPVLARTWGHRPAGALHDAAHRAVATRATSGIAEPVLSVRDPRIKALAHQAADTARAAGARYAEVRVTQTLWRVISSNGGPSHAVELGLSVRALGEGAWGWAATPTISTDEAVRVARLATTFALHAAPAQRTGPVARLELDTIPVATGDWTTPVRLDPFALDLEELHDWLFGVTHQLGDLQRARKAPPSIAWQDMNSQDYPSMRVDFKKQEWLFVSTEGAELTRTVILTTPSLNFFSLPAPTFNTPVQAGWDYLADLPIVPVMTQAMDIADATPPPPPAKPLEIGRYDVVFSAAAMAELLNATLAPATHLDRAIGDEAYAGSLSYLGPDPLARLGTAVASPLVTISADRSNPLGVATVPWDEEGVAPRDFPLVTNGILQNYQTTRTTAGWLAPWYEKRGQPVQSLGCAMAPSALAEPKQHTPNLQLHPGAGSETEASLVQGLEHGLHITVVPPPSPQTVSGNGGGGSAPLRMDWRCLQGYLAPFTATEIRHGKPVSTKPDAQSLGMFFNSARFWKNVYALGGAASVEYRGGYTSQKGDPPQFMTHSIGAVPARVNQLAFRDPGPEE